MTSTSKHDKWSLVSTYVKTRGLVKQHIESFNYFIDKGLKKIMRANAWVRFEQKEDLWLRYDDIRVGKPIDKRDKKKEKILTPQQCRISQQTYSAPIYVDISFSSLTNKRTELQKKNLLIGSMPIMLRSAHCHLSNCTESELSAMGECIYDKGGYFVVGGQEKVMLIQEQLAKNRIIINFDDKFNSMTAHVTSATDKVKSRTSVYFKQGQILIKHNALSKPIEFGILFKAMFIESDQEIVELIGADLISEIAASLQAAHNLTVKIDEGNYHILTAKLAQIYIAKQYKQRSNEKNANLEQIGERVVKDLIFGHILSNKAIYFGLVCRRLIIAKQCKSQWIDDKDYYGNKRLELSGHLMSLLFEDKFKSLNSLLQKKINDQSKYGSAAAQKFDSMQLPALLQRGSVILTEGIKYALSSGNWILSRFKMNKLGVTQAVSRLSYMSAIGHMTRIASSVEKTRKTSGPRALHGSQWGLLCPSDTPEGQGCGLIKNLALLCNISLDESDDSGEYIKSLCFCLGMEDIALLPHLFLNDKRVFTVWQNGECIGVHRNHRRFIADLRFLRRNGKISMYASICCQFEHKSILIATDQGRACRPLIICENGRSLLSEDKLKKLENGQMAFDDFVNEGIIEYLDVNEENNCFIALRSQNITHKTTHLEIDPVTILGVVSGLIPFPHHNQSPRNTYQCAMGKQAMGTIGINKFVRCDHLFYDLCYAQQPMVQTKTIQTINFDKIPAGCNAMLAVMSFSGYDIEDAVILNKASLDRGFMRCVVNRTEGIDFRYYWQSQKKDLLPKAKSSKDDANVNAQYRKFEDGMECDAEMALDKDGIAMPGATVPAHYGIMAIKFCPKDGHQQQQTWTVQNNLQQNEELNYFQRKCVWKHNNPAKIDRVILTSNMSEAKRQSPMILKIITREHRRPELGDKFSSRHGQKGVCGLIVPQCDMPFNDMGITPDLIMNPHGFPSRMTVGKMIELITGKVGVLTTEKYENLGSGFLPNTQFGDGSAFGKRDIVQNVCRHLVANGYSYSGKDSLTCGITGNVLSSYIFMGPVFYQKLKHMVGDKMHARSRGPMTSLTRQPTEGRSRKGGLRVGEMERDCLIGHGSSLLLYERLMVSSDKYTCQICKKCQLIASIPNYCNFCNSADYIAQTEMPYAAKLLFQELMSMNIAPRIELGERY